MLDKERVKELYLQGYNSTEIAKLLKAKRETVKKCIQRNFGNLKWMHEDAKAERREILRATNRESTKYISDKSFILKNRSIYRTKPNGDIVLKKECRGEVPWDVPKILVNEYKYA